MIAQSCFDIKVVVNELDSLVNSRIEKFYNTKEGELLIRGYSAKKGKFTLRALRGECIHLTDFKREIPDNPSGFTMLMRKYLNNSMIAEIYQPYFERIVIMKIKKGEEFFYIIIELFNKGNIVVCHEDFKIIHSLKPINLKDRSLKIGDVYDFLKPVFLESYLDKLEFKRIVKSSELDSIVKCVAINMGVGGRYAQEICFSAGIEYSKNPGMLGNDELEALFKSFSGIYMSIKHYKNIAPFIYMKNGVVENFSPIMFNSMAGFEARPFDSFNQACDFYYSNSQIMGTKDDNQAVFDSRISQLKKRLSQQEEYLHELDVESSRLAEIGRLIVGNNHLINNVLQKIRDAKNSKSWDEISSIIEYEKGKGIYDACVISGIEASLGNILFEINGAKFGAKINDNAFSLANSLFERSKKLRGKIHGALASAANTRLMIGDIVKDGVSQEEKIIEVIKPEKKWYEKFRWLKTSSDFLLVCGKDSTQNEIVVKKVAEPNDLIFHASVSGSPFGVLKNGLSAGDADKAQAASFVLCFSRAWRENLMADVFAVKKEQVSKTAPSGEYVSHGSFVISGQKVFFKNLRLELGVGISEGKVIAGDIELIKSRCEKNCILRPGGISPGKVAKRLMELFDIKDLSSEEYLAFIPGDCLIEMQ